MVAQPKLEKLADGVWAYVQPDGGWMINNMGLIDGPDGATSVDLTSTERRTAAYLSAAGEVAAPIRRVVLTHAHPDHCNGGSALPEAEIIAHRGAAEELRRPTVVAPHIFTPFEQGAIVPRMPSVIFDESLTIESGAHRVEVRHPGFAAHTAGDAFVWLPDERILFTGDLVFHGGTPFAISGSPQGWLRALEQLAALEPETVVPGHGEIGGPELLAPVADYLRFLIDAGQDAHRRGDSPLAAARRLDLGCFGDLIDRERVVGNLHRVIADLEGAPVDFVAAWQDMYEYNGARPLACHA